MAKQKIAIIGSGFAGLSAACFLSSYGYDVTVVEQHSSAGGRARQLNIDGFLFDMGPSWYWMPDVFDRFFKKFGKDTDQYYALHRLDPSYRVYFQDAHYDIPASYVALRNFIESIEAGAGSQLDKFLEEAAFKYRVGMNKLVFKPGISFLELLDKDLINGVLRLDVFTSMKKHVAQYFTHPNLRQLMEFPVIFLGAMAADTPALYSLMNYADIKGGTWFPQRGMYSIVEAMYQLGSELGVSFIFESRVKKIETVQDKAKGIIVESLKDNTSHTIDADVIISNADYHFTETALLPPSCRNYSDKYWSSRVMAPGCLLYYVGVNKKLPGLTHHSLFFDTDFDNHATEIYKSKVWPTNPLFYVCAASVTDHSVAPTGHENLFFLIPTAAGLEGDDEALRDKYFKNILKRFEERTGHSIQNNIVYYKSFAHRDFIAEYNSFKGNAYGLANTLFQTAHLKPGIRNKKLNNLFYTGQLTVPGPGVPPSLISGEVVAGLIRKIFPNK
jgi:phytoene desaturase